jgi:predicted Fe-Mo cluster-binding NifX family protein
VIVETDTSKITTVNNKDQEHAHGACNPLKKLNNEHVDAIVVGGIGMGALNVLNQTGIKVFQAQAPTVRENIDLLKKSSLPEFTSQNTCAGHGHGTGCGH